MNTANRPFIIFLGCILYIFTSCKENKSNLIEDDTAEYIKLSGNENCIDTVYFESVKLVPLETNEFSLIRSIDRIATDDKNLFIFDKTLSTLFIFDISGKYVDKIDDKGNGPGQYVLLYDFSLDKINKQLILYGDPLRKLLYFNYQGEFVREKKIEGSNGVKEFSSSDEDIYMLNYEEINSTCYLEKRNKKSLKFEDCLLQKSNIEDFSKYYKGNSLTSSNNFINVTRRFDNNIYRIKDGQISVRYNIDFGRLNFPLNFLEEGYPWKELESVFEDNKYVHTIVNVQENEKYLIFATNHSGFYTYNKESKVLKKHRFFMNTEYDISSSRMLNIENSDRIAFLITPLYLHGVKEMYKNHKQRMNDKLSLLLQNIDVEDNFILMIPEL